MYTVLSFIANELAPSLTHTSVLRAPHFLMLFAACAAMIVGIPAGKIEVPTNRVPLATKEAVIDNLLYLSAIIDLDESPAQQSMVAFWTASKANAHRVASRKVRFPTYVLALTGLLAK